MVRNVHPYRPGHGECFLEFMFTLGIFRPHHVVVKHNKSRFALCGWPGATSRYTISHRPSQKPAPLISVLDADFEVWFKKVCHAQLSL